MECYCEKLTLCFRAQNLSPFLKGKKFNFSYLHEQLAEKTRKYVDDIMLTVANKFNPDMTAMAVESIVTDRWKK